MAGNYPDVPGHRFVLDRDGTQAFYIDPGNVITQLTLAQIQQINREGGTLYSPSSANGDWIVALYFPEPRTITGIYTRITRQVAGSPTLVFESSENTTNFIDGTWTALGSLPSSTFNSSPLNPGYRQLINPLAVSNAKALRIKITNTGGSGGNWYIEALHVYGSLPTSDSPTRLAIWHPTLDEPIGGAYLDWGDSPRSSSADRTFRVKNLSASMTASDVLVAMDALTDGSPSVAGSHLVSDDGLSFAATETIPSLAPGAVSSALTLRRVLPSNAPLGLWSMRLHAVAGSWA